MKRVLVFVATVAALALTAPSVANAAPSGLTGEGACVQPGADRSGYFADSQLTGYRFVQDSDTTYGLIGTMTGSCPVLDADGYPTSESTAFTVEQMQTGGGTVYLDCFQHTFSLASNGGGGVSATGISVYPYSSRGTLVGTTAKQQKAICSTKDRLDKRPPTDARSTADYVRALNDLLSVF